MGNNQTKCQDLRAEVHIDCAYHKRKILALVNCQANDGTKVVFAITQYWRTRIGLRAYSLINGALHCDLLRHFDVIFPLDLAAEDLDLVSSAKCITKGNVIDGTCEYLQLLQLTPELNVTDSILKPKKIDLHSHFELQFADSFESLEADIAEKHARLRNRNRTFQMQDQRNLVSASYQRQVDPSHLQAGCHYCVRLFNQAWIPFYHHFIVVATHPKYVVIEYDGDAKLASGSNKAGFGRIVEQEFTYHNQQIWQVTYSAGYPALVVIERARSHVGEVAYHALENNCEHFARDCMIGVRMCLQVKPGSLVLHTIYATVSSVLSGFGTWIARAIAAAAADAVLDRAAPAMANSILGDAIGSGVGAILIEGPRLFLNIMTDHKLYKAGMRKKKWFCRRIIGHILRSTTRVALIAAGSACFQILIPIPFLGGFVGALIGNITAWVLIHLGTAFVDAIELLVRKVSDYVASKITRELLSIPVSILF